MGELRAIGVGLVLGCSGCVGWLRADAGPATSTTLARGRQGAALGADVALGTTKGSGLALDVGARGLVTGSTGDVSATLGALYFQQPDPGAFYAMGGVSALHLGASDGAFCVGAASPFAEAGLVFTANRHDVGPLYTVGTRISYDVRFTQQPHEGFWTVEVGVALGGRTGK